MNSICADYQYVDFKYRWHGLSTSPFRIIISGILCAFSFPKRAEYDIFITSDPQLPAVLMKKLGLLRKNQKIVSYLGSQTLYFTYSGYYSRITRMFYKFLLSSYDYHICNGPMQAELLKNIISVEDYQVRTNINGLKAAKKESLSRLKYDPGSKIIAFIGNLYSDWRLHYKGIDLMLDAIYYLKTNYSQEIKIKLIGDYKSEFVYWLKQRYGESYSDFVILTGKAIDISSELENIGLYLHTSRGDAYPNAVIESLAAGLPAIVSEWTGTKNLVDQVSPEMITKLDVADISNKIMAFFQKDSETKLMLSNRAREVVKHLEEAYAINTFQDIVKNIGDGDKH
jgi:glycosyltransferase involved in cell wall biosynthesis